MRAHNLPPVGTSKLKSGTVSFESTTRGARPRAPAEGREGRCECAGVIREHRGQNAVTQKSRDARIQMCAPCEPARVRSARPRFFYACDLESRRHFLFNHSPPQSTLPNRPRFFKQATQLTDMMISSCPFGIVLATFLTQGLLLHLFVCLSGACDFKYCYSNGSPRTRGRR